MPRVSIIDKLSLVDAVAGCLAITFTDGDSNHQQIGANKDHWVNYDDIIIYNKK